jgi:hypothetical protein
MRLGFWRKCRVCFRWCRIVVWLLLLILLCTLIWFNRVGLPDFLKTRLVAKLHSRGIELEFSRLRLHLRGVVAENVRVGGKDTSLPTLTLAEVQVRPDFDALRQFQLQVGGLILHRGKFVWIVTPTNTLTVDHIETDLRIQTNNTWSLDNFRADFAGAKISLSGDIAHAPEFSNWAIFRAPKTGGHADWPAQLKNFHDTLARIHFESQPQLSLSVNGDARDTRSFKIRLNLNASSVQTPWFAGKNIQLAADFAAPNGVPSNFGDAWPWWTNSQQAVRLSGKLEFANGAILGAAIDSVRGHFSYSNLVWRVPDLTAAQSETWVELSGNEDDASKMYACHVRGAFNPEVMRPFLTTSNALRAFNRYTLNEPAHFDVNVSGCLKDWDSLGATGNVALTNLVIRGQSAESVAADFSYTNRVLEIFHPQMLRAKGSQILTAEKVTLDFNTKLAEFTNGFSTTEPMMVARAIGPKIGRLLEPYQFAEPPTVNVSGRLPLRDVNSMRDLDDADMTFEVVQGRQFQWLRLKAPRITGTIHWLGETLLLTNIAAAFYGGDGNGHADFDFSPPHPGADYRFAFNVTNVDLHRMMQDLASPSNKLEGTLAGRLVVTSASTESLQTWNGFGHEDLRDGLLWDVPVFGILSPALNAMTPGLGNSRATDAAARFIITNGVIFTDSMEIRSTMTRLQYTGTVDLRQNVNARVEAQLLRDTPVIGPAVSLILTPFTRLLEYKVTGTLQNPKKEPVYVPKIFLLPLHPIRSIEEMFPGGDVVTNPPPPEK